MRRSHFSAALVALTATLVSIAPAIAGPVEKEIIQPSAPVSPWEFRIEAYGWLTGLDGTAGAGNFKTNVDAPFFNEVLDHLDFAAALQLEVRKGRWGVMADGFYAKLGAVGDTPGPLYSSASVDLKQAIVELAVTFRVLEGKAGFIDVYAGGRYNYMGLDIAGSVSRAGVQKVSDNVSDRVVRNITNRAILAVALRDLAPDSIDRKDISRIARDLDKNRIELANAVAARSGASPGQLAVAQNRVDRAEKKLADAITRRLLRALPSEESANEHWVDPLIGLRGQWNITERFFFAAQADIGGFGVSSRLAWLAQATLGFQFNRNIFAEAGYRYLSTDYTDGAFLYDVAQGGAFVGLGVKF